MLNEEEEKEAEAEGECTRFVRLFHSECNAHVSYLLLELAEQDLLDWFIREDWSINHLLQFFETMMDAVDTMHRLNVIHRDIKPENVLCSKRGGDEWHFFLTDFGSSFQGVDGAHVHFSGSLQYTYPPWYQACNANEVKVNNITRDLMCASDWWALFLIISSMFPTRGDGTGPLLMQKAEVNVWLRNTNWRSTLIVDSTLHEEELVLILTEKRNNVIRANHVDIREQIAEYKRTLLNLTDTDEPLPRDDVLRAITLFFSTK